MKNSNNFCSVFNRRADAVAFVNGGSKYPDIRGRVMFYSMCNAVIVRSEITGLPRNNKPCENPVFAFHIHSGDRCTGNQEDEFADAKSHYNPNDCLHPYHAGDMPPLFGVDGSAFSVFMTNRFTIREVLGRTVIIHAHPDDFSTQPSGNSGEKIACGIITPTAR